jgi:oxygen-independent coproporphyrinogen-3 oxidase
LGPSAHSFNGTSRQWNISNNQVYIQSINEGKIPFEKEVLTTENKFNEYILTSLRTMWGCSLKKIKNDFGEVVADNFSNQISKYVNENLVENTEQNYVLTQKGKFFADKIASELFLLNN